MKNIKETIIGVFAVIGFVVIASGFSINNTTQEQQTIFEFEIASDKFVVKYRFFLFTFLKTICSKPGSKIGIIP